MIRRTFFSDPDPMAPSRHSPIAGAVWMMVAGLCFAAVNSLSQYVSFKLGLASTQVAFHQYLIALICLLPWLVRHGLRQSLMTNQFRLHLLRVALAVIGIQFWLWALAVPVPIWQGIALLMTSPLFATLGSALLLKEQVSRARILATLAGFAGAMVILAPGPTISAGPPCCRWPPPCSGPVTPCWCAIRRRASRPTP